MRGDGSALPFVDVFDAVFSAATFHWIPDHDRLFASIHQALKPGGRLVAQAGGQGNLDRLYGRARLLMRSPAWSPFFSSWIEPSHFEDAGDTERRLARAGFLDIEASITPAPVTFGTADGYAEFTAAVCLRHQLDRLPLADREPFMEQITEQALADDPPLTLDYRRLNITARKGRA